MKKFITYSLIATVFIVVIGTMIVFDTFDLKFGQSNNFEIDTATFNPAKIHNEIVDSIHNLAIESEKIKKSYNEFTPDSNIENLKSQIQTLSDKKDELVLIINNKEFSDRELNTVELFHSNYLPALEGLINTYLKAVTYFEEKEFTQEAIDSFHGVIDLSEKALEEAHNNFVEELNSHKH